MKVIKLRTNPLIYSANSYLVLGTWNRINDLNTLIDTGSDDYILDHIESIHTGLGKNKIDQVILTHSHFDHVGGTSAVKDKYNAKVFASNNFHVADNLLSDNDSVLIGDCLFKVIYTPGHSSDSISLYCEEEEALFSGDLTLKATGAEVRYTEEYINSFKKLSKLKINIIYPGHGEPIIENAAQLINDSLEVMQAGLHKGVAFSY